MGTDRTTEFEGPCLCGEGTFRIDDCEVDHAWPTATPQWYEGHIHCRNCAAKYELVKRGKRFVLVKRSELQEIDSKRTQAYDAGVHLMARPEVLATLNTFAALLTNQPSMAATHRLLVAEELEYSSVGTFRKGWSGGADWIRRHIKPDNLLRIYQIVNAPRDDLETWLADVERLNAAAAVTATPVGEPVYEIFP